MKYTQFMFKVRRSKDRGHADHGWLKSFHTFSFADYRDPQFMGYRCLRVINEDLIEAGKGFGTHPHKNMEIITYIVQGELTHKDSMGNTSKILPGEIQKMSAGTGVLHSEFNESKNKTHLLQIWIEPNLKNIPPMYAQKNFEKEIERASLTLVLSPQVKDGSLPISQDALMYVGKIKEDLNLDLDQKRYYWLQLIKGELNINGDVLNLGDGVAIERETVLNLETLKPSEFLFFELP